MQIKTAFRVRKMDQLETKNLDNIDYDFRIYNSRFSA